MAKNVTVTPADGDIQFENTSGTAAGRIEQSGDDLVISNAVGDVLFGDANSDVYIGDGVNSVDLLFEQSGSIKAEDGSTGVTLTLGSSDTTLSLYAPQITNLSTQSSEATALMINGSNVVGTRELGSAAFSASTDFVSASGDTISGNLDIVHASNATGLTVRVSGGAVPTTPQLKVGRDTSQYWGVYTNDGVANLVHRQDETGAGDNHHTKFQIWSSGGGTHSWQWITANNSGSSTSEKMKLTKDSALTLGGGTNTITNTKVGNWDTAYSWGNHASAGYSTFDGAYSSLSGIPSTFAPSSHNHDGRYYTESESDQRFPRGRTVTYTDAEDSGGADAWYKIFQVSDSGSSPVECHIRCYAHTSLAFIVSEGYQGGDAHINILDALSSSTNNGYKFIEGVRVASNGDVEVLLNGGSNVSIEMTLIGDATPVSALVVSTTEAVNIKDSVTVLSNGMIRTYGKLYIGDTDTSTTATTALVLNGEEVESRTLGSNAFNSTSYLPLGGGTMTGNVLLGANKIAADTTAPTAHIQVGAGTTNTGNRSDIALLGGSNSGGVINALGLVNTAAGANSNGVALNFHNGNSWSPTGQIIVQQNSSGTSTDSAMKFYTYDGGLNHRMSIKNDGTVRFLAYGAGLIASDANGNLSVDTSTYLTSIADNSIGISELNVTDGTAGQVLTTDGNGTLSFSTAASGGENNVQSNWNETDTSSDAFILNKPNLFDGAYSSLSGVPSTFAPSSHNHDSRYYTESEMQHFMARALGWVSGYGNSAAGYVNYNFTEDAVEISGGGDDSTGGIFKAIRVKSGDKVRFTVMLKGSTGSSTGLYLRLYQHNGDMPDGKTHVSNNATSSEGVVQEDDSGVTNWEENRPVPSAWTNYEVTYTAPADGYVSLVVLNWSGHGEESIYVKQPDIQFEKVNDASKLGGTDASSYLTAHPAVTEATTNLSNSGRTYIQSITLDSNGHVTGVSTGTETVTNTNTTYSAGSGLDLTSTTFSVEADLRDGITHIGKDTSNYITFDSTNSRIDFYAGGTFVARMESDGDLHIKGDVIAFSSIFG